MISIVVQVAADVGEGVTLRCGVRAHPRPEFSWARADQATLSSRLGRIMAQVSLYQTCKQCLTGP